MDVTRRGVLSGAALAAVSGLALTACGSGSSSGGGSAEGGSDFILKAQGSEPQNTLIPGNTNEVGGGMVVEFLFAGLVSYTPTGDTKLEMAESMDSTDNLTWTIKIKQGWKFHDGTEVKAKNFVDAWNYTAAAKNAQLGIDFMAPIKGSADLAAEGATATELEGLKVVDDYTFTVLLSDPEKQFPQRLGYPAYSPLPDSFFAASDKKAWGENPVGNGPYKMATTSGSWVHNESIKVIKNPDYKGNREAKNGGITYLFYTSQDTAYQDLQAGNVDTNYDIPATALAAFTTDLGAQAINQPGGTFQSFTIPERLAGFANDDEGRLRRAAISRAINRELICDKVFQGTRTPAKDYTTPALANFDANVPGNEVLVNDDAEAKKLWDQANAIKPWNGTFKLSYNADAGTHKAWVEAVCNQLQAVLPELKATPDPIPTFAELRKSVTSREIQSAFRTGWSPDYPNRYNYLAPLYRTGAGSNDGDYTNADFDKQLIAVGAAADAAAEATEVTKAQAILLKDLPAMPLWYQNTVGGYSTNVKAVPFKFDGYPALYLVEKA